MEQTYSPQQIADKTGKGRDTIMSLIRCGQLVATDERLPGSKYPRFRVKASAFDDWQQGRTVSPVVRVPQPKAQRSKGRGIVARTLAKRQKQSVA